MSAVEAIGRGMAQEWDDLLDHGVTLVCRYSEALCEAKRKGEPSGANLTCVEAKRALGEHLKKMLLVAREAGRTTSYDELIAILKSRPVPSTKEAVVSRLTPVLFSNPPVATPSPRQSSATTTLVFMDGR